MTIEINTTEDVSKRLKELMAKKKKLNATIRRGRKIQIKARVEKKKVDTELKSLKERASKLRSLSPEEARELVRREIEAVDPKSVYPADLERQFDRLDQPNATEHKVVDLGKIPERPISKVRREEEDETVGSAEVGSDEVETEEEAEEGVLDLSDQ